MGSYNKPQKPNSYYSIDYSYGSEGLRFPKVVYNYVGDNPKSREDKDVYFRVSKESEQMLV